MRPLDVHYYWCRFTGSIKTSNICCGSFGGAGISSGGAGISSGGAGFSSGAAGILLVRVRLGGAGFRLVVLELLLVDFLILIPI